MADPTLFDLLAEPDQQTYAAALQDALRRRAATGALIQGIGGRRLGPIGAGMVRSADAGLEQQAGFDQANRGQRLRLAMEAAGLARQQAATAEAERHNRAMEAQAATNSAQDAWGAIADPVTGGILLYNKKTRETVPLGPGGGPPKPAPAGGPLPGLPGKPTEGQRKSVLAASESISQLDMAIDALKKAPGAYGGTTNFAAALLEQAGGTPAQSLMSRRYSADELKVKNYVSNVVSKIINERAGANVTYREELRQKFLPQDFDSYEQALQKLHDLKAMQGETYKAQGSGMVPDPAAPPDPSPAAPAPAPVRKFTRGKDGKLVEVK